MEARVFEVAGLLFAKHGYRGTSLQDIANAVGISRQALYHYVDSKEALLGSMTEQLIKDGRQVLRDAEELEGCSPAERVRAYLHASIVETAARRHAFLFVDQVDVALPGGALKAFAVARQEIRDAVARMIRDAVEAREFRPVDARIAANLLWSVITGVAHWYHDDQDQSIDSVARELTDMTLHGLREGADASGGSGASHALSQLRSGLEYLERELATQGAIEAE